MITDVPEEPDPPPPTTRRGLALPTWLRASSPVPVWIGFATVSTGFVVLAVTWGRVAGLLAVPLQLPYLVSGGSVGVSLVMAGLVAVHTSVRRREQARRERALQRLADNLAEVRAALAERDGR